MTAAFVQSLSSSPFSIVDIAFEIAWKSALLCLAVWGAHMLAGRKRLLLRSALWHLCLAGLLLLPVAIVVAPRLHVATPFAQTQRESSGLAYIEQKSPAGGDDLAPFTATDGRDSPAEAAAFETAVEFSDTPRSLATPARSASAGVKPLPRWRFGLVRNVPLLAAGALYLLTLAILLIRLAASLTAVAALRRESILVVNPAWLRALERWHSQFGLRPPVQLLVSECVSVPIVVGWRRPAILLPPGLAQTTDRQAIDAVLLHELTHVGRGDYAWNVLLRIVQAIYWPHPFVWFTGRMVRQVREEVCDAVCVHWMGDVGAYCAILVDVAAGLVQSSEVALGMAMTRTSRLARRLARVQHSKGTDRGLLRRPIRAAIGMLVLVSTGLLGTVQIVARVSAAGQSPPDSPAQSLAEAANAQSPVGAAADDRVAFADESQTEEKPADPSPVVDESKPLQVKTAKVQRGTFKRTTLQPASLEAFGQISIHSRNAGLVSKVLVDVGDRIKAGDVLAELDFPDIDTEIAEKEAALALAEANEEHAKVVIAAAQAVVQSLAAKVAQAEADSEKAASYESFRAVQFGRVKKLFELKSIDERLVDEKSEQLEAAKFATRSAAAAILTAKAAGASGDIEVRLAESSLKPAALRTAAARADVKRAVSKTQDGFRVIRSPIDGVVLEQNIEADVNVKPGEGKPLFRLAGTSLITAVVQLPERDALLVKRNNRATVQFDALAEVGPIAGKVSRVAYSIERLTRTLHVEISLPNVDGKLKPGMFGRATVVLEEIPDVLSVPSPASFYMGDSGTQVICVRVVNGRTVRTPVKVGLDNGEQAEIVEGLTAGDVVIVGLKNLPPDGQPIEIIPPRKDDK